MSESTSQYLNKAETLGLKGYMCICVLFHHIYQFTGWFSHSYFGHFLNLLGEWAVAVFLFMSGYGLFCSYKEKGDSYLDRFLKKRVIPLYIEYAIFVLIYWLFDFNNIDNVIIIVKSFLWGGTIVSFGWYFQMILVLYLAFYFTFKFLNSRYARCICFLAIGIIYALLSDKAGLQHTALSSFFFGLFCSVHKSELGRVLGREKRVITVIILSFAVFFSAYMMYVRGNIMGKFEINHFMWGVISALSDFAIILFVIGMIRICSGRIRLFDNTVIRRVGVYSLEIYAMQGLVLRKLFPLFQNRVIYVISSVMLISLIAFAIHHLFEMGKRKLTLFR